MVPSNTYFASLSLGDGLRRADRTECAAAIASQPQVNADSRLPLLKRQKLLRQFMLRSKRSQHDPIQFLRSSYFALIFERPRFQPYHQESRLLQRSRELPVAQIQCQLRLLLPSLAIALFGRGLHELLSGFHQSQNLGCFQRPAIKSHVRQIAPKWLSAGKLPICRSAFGSSNCAAPNAPFATRLPFT